MRTYILIIILVLFLQGYSSGEALLKNSIASYQTSGTLAKASGVVGSVQAYFEQDGCQFVQKGSHLAEMFIDTGMGHAEVIEGLPRGYRDLPLYQREFPVEFYINISMPEELIEPIYEVVSEWNTEVGFEVFTVKDTYNLERVYARDPGSSHISQVDRTDQKNVIYWIVPSDYSILGSARRVALSRMLPSPVRFIDDSNRLPFNETNIFINSNSSIIHSLTEGIESTMSDITAWSWIMQNLGVQWPSNYLQDFESFQQTKQEWISFVRKASAEQLLEFGIKERELMVESLRRTAMNYPNDDSAREYSQMAESMNQRIEDIKNMPPDEAMKMVLLPRPDSMIRTINNLFTRFRFELFIDREKGLVYFKNILKHEMGHALGLDDLYEDDIDIADQTQIPLMWYDIENGIDPNNPEPYFDNPLEVDRYTLHALSCNYDLEALRSQAQQP